MKCVIAVLIATFLATAAWAGFGLPNELANPGFEGTTDWSVSGNYVNSHIPYQMVAPFGIAPAPGGGSYAAGVAGQSLAFGGGEIWQIVDESQYPGWNPDYNTKEVSLEFHYFALGLADVPMLMNVYLDYMKDGSYPDPQSPLYVKQNVATYTGNSSGWNAKAIDVTLPYQPRYLSVHFEFSYFSGTGVMLIDNVNLQGRCVPEPSSLLALGTGLLGAAGMIRRKR